ncbi:hypothetical protein P691DRAFT_719014 [Macrolepiota fuliginosa MF-IS2]|uniref:Mitochondrial adapter protein MCP1 transmembrane domain-containing protein n=1 Tax=Macrolepiota fuliginosa MF-IS2 TaxID=1400762 RepID=A0A9P5XLE3_9AGAR|nr:hypothetical protein P691DRAFT_719014 [Macrolepiota fuliginosa MF-IS2]
MSNTPGGGNNGSTRRKIASALVAISHASSPFITTFLLIHLAAPALANIGGSGLASQTMLLGREYYQTNFGESYLVLAPITVHALAGISKRLLLSSIPASADEDPKDEEATRGLTPSLRPLKSLLSLTGYATAFFFLPVHFLLHRYYPALPMEPITSVGPSSLDYEYIKYGLHTWPWRSWLLYAGLVSSVALHAADGAALIWSAWFKKSWGELSRKTRRTIAIGCVVTPVLLGLSVIAREPPMLMSFLESRYRAAYTQSDLFRL